MQVMQGFSNLFSGLFQVIDGNHRKWMVGWKMIPASPFGLFSAAFWVGFSGVYLSLMSFAGENPCMRLFRIMGCNELQFGGPADLLAKTWTTMTSDKQLMDNKDGWKSKNRGYPKMDGLFHGKMENCKTLLNMG